MLGIPFYVWDFADRFKEDVIDDFVEAYAEGRTPNPCVKCNEKIKFAALADRAVALGFDAVATGHYARLQDGRLRRAVDADKDQSYVLGVLTPEQLRRAMFPVGDSPKPDIRAEAEQRGLLVANKPDSHDICFIPSGDTQAFLGARIGVRRGMWWTRTAVCWRPMPACMSSPSVSARDWGWSGPPLMAAPIRHVDRCRDCHRPGGNR